VLCVSTSADQNSGPRKLFRRLRSFEIGLIFTENANVMALSELSLQVPCRTGDGRYAGHRGLGSGFPASGDAAGAQKGAPALVRSRSVSAMFRL